MADTAIEPPPSYSSLPPSQPETQPSQPATSSIPSLAERSGTHEYQLQHVGHHSLGLQIVHDTIVLYYIASYQAQNTPDLILYAGYDSKGPQLALAEFTNYTKDFKIYIGGQKSPKGDDWDTVRCADGGFFKDPIFRFEVPRIKQKLYWKKTSESRLGASRFSPRDHKLVDEGSDEVVAVYLERKLGLGGGQNKGVVKWRVKLSEMAEMQALMVLLSLLERSRRYMRSVNRAFPNTNGW
ncbi:hypothetical protein AC579_9451 [Pseudocercospora musae]|uniref:Uncharacterized protein n=1 Tax=Pseudocercospora musae TaxID=113226 RepID=A0A139I9N8_9PEZI|nr:hypothetical protein AC579_9451 [Pseudocercospora musae]